MLHYNVRQSHCTPFTLVHEFIMSGEEGAQEEWKSSGSNTAGSWPTDTGHRKHSSHATMFTLVTSLHPGWPSKVQWYRKGMWWTIEEKSLMTQWLLWLVHTLIRKLLQTNIPGTIIKFIANYIKGRKAYTTYTTHPDNVNWKLAFHKEAFFHPHSLTFTPQTYHHRVHRFRSWPTQMTSPSHPHTHTYEYSQ